MSQSEVLTQCTEGHRNSFEGFRKWSRWSACFRQIFLTIAWNKFNLREDLKLKAKRLGRRKIIC